MARRSDQQKAEALAVLDANAGNVSKTARDTGIPRKTLEEWRDGRVAEGVAELRQEKKEGLADRLEAIALQMLDAMPSKILDASLKDTATAVGIAIDKRQLLTGQPTAIQRNEGLTEDERASRVAELLGRARDRRTTAVPDGRGAGGAGRAAGALH